MDFVKNKYGIAFVLIIALAAVHYFFFHKKCEEPTKMDKVSALMSCIPQLEAIPIDELRKEACEYVGKTENCEFDPEEFPKIQEMLNNKMLKCVKKELELKNKCSDKVKDILNEI